jgi:cholesterol transport system auxiliary component
VPSRNRAYLPVRIGAVILASSLVSACASGPAPVTFDLTAPPARERGAIRRQVVVNQPAAVQVLSGQNILVKDASSGTVSFLKDGQWADSLPNLLQARLIQTFENASSLRGVTRPSSGAVADVQLVSDLRSFQVMTPANEAEVQIAVKVVNDQNGRILAGRIFTAAVPVASVDAPHVARALDEALSNVMLDVVRWVGSMRLPSRDDPLPQPSSPT